MSIKAGYICDTCGVKTTDVEVRERFEGENIIHYTQAVMRVVAFDHGMRSPLCKAKTAGLLLPMTQNGIGVDGPPLTDEERNDIDKRLKEK